MSKMRVTQWHLGYDKPKYEGVYQRILPNGNILWSKWSENSWRLSLSIKCRHNFDMAHIVSGKSAFTLLPWRGVTYV